MFLPSLNPSCFFFFLNGYELSSNGEKLYAYKVVNRTLAEPWDNFCQINDLLFWQGLKQHNKKATHHMMSFFCVVVFSAVQCNFLDLQ